MPGVPCAEDRARAQASAECAVAEVEAAGPYVPHFDVPLHLHAAVPATERLHKVRGDAGPVHCACLKPCMEGCVCVCVCVRVCMCVCVRARAQAHACTLVWISGKLEGTLIIQHGPQRRREQHWTKLGSFWGAWMLFWVCTAALDTLPDLLYCHRLSSRPHALCAKEAVRWKCC